MDDTVKTRRRSHWKLSATTVALLLFLSLMLFLFAVNKSMLPAMASMAEARINSITMKAMYRAILDNMDDDTIYAELIDTYETGEKVYMLKANTRNMNLLAADCATAAQEQISQIGAQGIALPIGTLSGISFLSGRGPNIRASFTPVGSVTSKFESELTSSGINQSLYRVNLILTASVRLIMPGVYKTLTISTQAAIAESIIVGEVPQVYTDVANTDDMLNLIPTEPQP